MSIEKTIAIAILIALAIGCSPVGSSEGIDQAPVAVIQPLPEVMMGNVVILNGSASHGYNNITDLTWYIRGSEEELPDQSVLGSGEVIESVFDMCGIFIINLTVTDTEGLKGWVEKQVMVIGVDLAVTMIELSDPTENDLQAGDRPTVSIGYKNIGAAAIDTPWVLRLRYNGATVLEETINSTLGPNEQAYFNSTSVLEAIPGELPIEVWLDADGDIDEMTEINNRLSRSLTVDDGLPNMDDDDISVDDDDESEGSTEETIFPVTLVVLMCMILGMIGVIIGIPLIIAIVVLKRSKKGK